MSDWYQIENSQIIVQVNSLGAEVKRFFNKIWNKEVLWSGDEKIWPRSAPILFPIVGGLKNNEYSFKGKTYRLNRHGFLRDLDFDCISCQGDRLTFSYDSNEETRKYYPFDFKFLIEYALKESSLHISIEVINTGLDTMYFQVGAHPGFDIRDLKSPLLKFDKVEKEFFRINKEELVDFTTPIIFSNDSIMIGKDTFNNDAMIFKNPHSSFAEIESDSTSEIIRVHFHKIPYLGIWGKPGNQFVCIEPWHGVADTTLESGELEKKVGINKLFSGTTFKFNYEIELLNRAVMDHG